jgi:hypothetical protein
MLSHFPELTRAHISTLLLAAGVAGVVVGFAAQRSWDLRCEVREKILQWVTIHYPHALPQARVMLDDAPELCSGLNSGQPGYIPT